MNFEFPTKQDSGVGIPWSSTRYFFVRSWITAICKKVVSKRALRINKEINKKENTRLPITTMPYRKISYDVKLAAVNLYERNLLTIRQIVGCVGFTERTFWRIMKLWRETGDVVRRNTGLPGRPRSLHFEDINYLLHLVNHRPDWFLDELLGMLQTNRFISIHFTTIHRDTNCPRM